MEKSNKGISLISLIVTIIVIIILAGISFFSGLGTQEKANFSKFTEEINNIRVSVANYRSESLVTYDDANYGFKKVYVKNAPSSFSSFSGDGADKIGYLVDFNLIDYSLAGYGNQEITGEQVVFEKDDVFVFDSKGIIYYALGREYDGKIYYNAKTYREKGGN